MRANAEHRDPRLALRFAGASLVVFLAVGVAAHTVVRRQVQADDQNNAQFHAVFVTDSLLVPIFHGIDLQKPWSQMPKEHQDWLLHGSGDRHITYEWKQRGDHDWQRCSARASSG